MYTPDRILAIFKSVNIPTLSQSAIFDFLDESDEVKELIRHAATAGYRDIRRVYYAFGCHEAEWCGLPSGPGCKNYPIAGILDYRARQRVLRERKAMVDRFQMR
jgi:hypothetical protein